MSHVFRHFPREVDMRKRKVVHSMDELQRYVKATNGADNLTTTVYGFRELKGTGKRGEYTTAIVPHFVMDFDYERAKINNVSDEEAGNQCLREVSMVHHHLLSNEIKHAMWFTGGGIHIWVNLDKTYYPDGRGMSDLMTAGRRIVEGWVKEWSLRTLDPVVSFRPDRHIRIPNTYNFKRGLWGFPITTEDFDLKWTDIIKRAMNPSGGMVCYGTNGMALHIEERDPDKPFEAQEVEVDMKKVGNINVLPCLAASSCKVGDNPPHEARVMLMLFLQDRFRSFARPPESSNVSNDSIIESVCSFIEDLKWSDYNEETTHKYVSIGVSRYYKTPSCRTLYDKGYCIGRCPFYDKSGGV
tara:strand:- start:1493 stop:2557 length:1065 start_codon:yes stop_codon:yes gene_type:complete